MDLSSIGQKIVSFMFLNPKAWAVRAVGLVMKPKEMGDGTLEGFDIQINESTSSPEAIQSAYEQAAGISTGGVMVGVIHKPRLTRLLLGVIIV